MSQGFFVTRLAELLQWARAGSLWYLPVNGGCCADELMEAAGCRYDLERFGCLPQVDPRQADLLVITGAVSYKAAPHLRELYDAMLEPKYVLAVGACASCGGPFGPEYSYSTVPGVDRILPIDMYVPGCPPRPEAILNGLIHLQEKIRGRDRLHSQA